MCMKYFEEPTKHQVAWQVWQTLQYEKYGKAANTIVEDCAKALTRNISYKKSRLIRKSLNDMWNDLKAAEQKKD